MKFGKLFSLLVLVILTAFLFVSPVFALQDDIPITDEQVIIVGAVASVLTFTLSALATYGNVHLTRFWANVLLFGVSNVFAFTWSGLSLSPFPWSEPSQYWQWLNDLAVAVMPIFGVATFVYNLLYSKVVVPVWNKVATIKKE